MWPEHSKHTFEVQYRAGDLVYVRSVSGGMWVAQLTEPVIKIGLSGGGERFNIDRPKVRYFVPTAELGSYAHAMELCGLMAAWGQSGRF